jgi:WS/DGAT/MGAT family acyltransferase
MSRLGPIDAAFITLESSRTPMNIGALLTFKLPPRAPRDYLRTLFATLREQAVTAAPFNYRLVQKRLPRLAPEWETVASLDLDYHLRHSSLPWPGGERELGVLVARLHSNAIDLARPPWEMHLIEGLERRRFAIYFKAHHSAWDGIGALGMVKTWLSTDPDARNVIAPWALPARAESGGKDAEQMRSVLRRTLELAGDQLRSAGQLVRTLRRMSDRAENPEGGAYSALETPRTPFNVAITPQRRLATQLYELSRFKAIGDATGATINDICLVICAAAVRRYLRDLGQLPGKPLIASMPVGLSRPDGKAGNAVAGLVCPLPTLHDDLLRGLGDVCAVTRRGKEQLRSMSPSALQQFTLLGLSPLILGQMTGLAAKAPPIFNFVVSNVVASRHQLYFNGAELEAMYPISVLFDGYALNVTVVGYADRLGIGFTGCRDALPSLQRLAVYTGEALMQLERVALPDAGRRSSRRKAR